MSSRISSKVANVYFAKNSNISKFYQQTNSNAFKVNLMSQAKSKPKTVMTKRPLIPAPYTYKRHYSTLMFQSQQEKMLVEHQKRNLFDPLCYLTIITLFAFSIVNVVTNENQK